MTRFVHTTLLTLSLTGSALFDAAAAQGLRLHDQVRVIGKGTRFTQDMKAFGVQAVFTSGRFRVGAGPSYTGAKRHSEADAGRGMPPAPFLTSALRRVGAVTSGNVTLGGPGAVELGAQYHLLRPVGASAVVLTARIRPRWM